MWSAQYGMVWYGFIFRLYFTSNWSTGGYGLDLTNYSVAGQGATRWLGARSMTKTKGEGGRRKGAVGRSLRAVRCC
jgi:hypothetical protein